MQDGLKVTVLGQAERGPAKEVMAFPNGRLHGAVLARQAEPVCLFSCHDFRLPCWRSAICAAVYDYDGGAFLSGFACGVLHLPATDCFFNGSFTVGTVRAEPSGRLCGPLRASNPARAALTTEGGTTAVAQGRCRSSDTTVVSASRASPFTLGLGLV